MKINVKNIVVKSKVSCFLIEIEHQNVLQTGRKSCLPTRLTLEFSRVACALFELRHLPPPPQKNVSKFFKLNFRNGFLCRFVPCKSYKLKVFEKTCKSETPYYFGESFLSQCTFQTRSRVIIVL